MPANKSHHISRNSKSYTASHRAAKAGNCHTSKQNSLGYHEPLFSCEPPVHPFQRMKISVVSFFKRSSSEDQCYLMMKELKHSSFWQDRIYDNYWACSPESRKRIQEHYATETLEVGNELLQMQQKLEKLRESKQTHCFPLKVKHLESKCYELDKAKTHLEKALKSFHEADLQKEKNSPR